MAVLTEIELRQLIRERGEVDSITVQPHTLITPAARQFLQERRIRVVTGEGTGRSIPGAKPDVGGERAAASSGSEPVGARLPVLDTASARRQAATPPPGTAQDTQPTAIQTEKPEHLTHLRGRMLVPKTHPRIRLRGQVDSAQAYVLLAQVAACKGGDDETYRNLGELLDRLRRVMRAEVMDEPLPALSLFGLDEADLRRHSHRPWEHLGIDHIVPSVDYGELLVWLNLVRTQLREAELAAIHAFWRENGPPDRLDILQWLNRLSSAAYILVCRVVARARKAGAPGEA